MLTSLKTVICPYPENTQFVGRKSILEQVKKELQQDTKTVALYGLGGVGYK